MMYISQTKDNGLIISILQRDDKKYVWSITESNGKTTTSNPTSSLTVTKINLRNFLKKNQSQLYK